MAGKQRRDQGSGSIFQRSSDGMWIAYVTLPPHPMTGKRRRRTVSAKRKVDAMAKLRDLQRRLLATGDLPTASPTVEQYMRGWLTRIAKPNVKPRTYEGYRSYVENYIIPALGRKRMEKLGPADVARMTSSMVESGKSSTTALQAHRILQRALQDALREGVVDRNAAKLAVAPRRAVSSREALTVAQAVQLLKSTAGSDYWPRWLLGLLTGCRQGEALGLTGASVAYQTGDNGEVVGGTAHFDWALQRLPASVVELPAGQEGRRVAGALWLVRPKSKKGRRSVDLAPVLAQALHRAHPDSPDGFFFVDHGHPVDPRVDWQRWKDALVAAGLPDVPLHSMRHTAASLLRAIGTPDRIRMDMLGHASLAVTDGYTHTETADQAAFTRALERLLLPTPDP